MKLRDSISSHSTASHDHRNGTDETQFTHKNLRHPLRVDFGKNLGRFEKNDANTTTSCLHHRAGSGVKNRNGPIGFEMSCSLGLFNGKIYGKSLKLKNKPDKNALYFLHSVDFPQQEKEKREKQ